MRIITTCLMSCSLLALSACVSDNVLTREEIEIQSKSADMVSSVLFEYDLDSSASYNIRKDGFVVINFDQSVSEKKYTEVVNLLRESTSIKGVRAEQGGAEVCGLPR